MRPASLAQTLLAQEGIQARLAWSLLGVFFQGACLSCQGRVESPRLGRLCRSCWDSLPELSFPRCPRCCLPLPPLTWKGREEVSCRDCRRLRPRFGKAAALFPFTGKSRDLIHEYKFNSATSLRRPLARCLELAYRSVDWEIEHQALVHVPSSGEVLKKRGFDHVADLACDLSSSLGMPWIKALEKRSGLKRQSDLSRAQRLLNTREAYLMKEGSGVAGLDLLLLDDVLTTGATASSCARTLIQAGARRVDVLTLARSV